MVSYDSVVLHVYAAVPHPAPGLRAFLPTSVGCQSIKLDGDWEIGVLLEVREIAEAWSRSRNGFCLGHGRWWWVQAVWRI